MNNINYLPPKSHSFLLVDDKTIAKRTTPIFYQEQVEKLLNQGYERCWITEIDNVWVTLNNISDFPCELDLDIVQGATEIELTCFVKPNTKSYYQLRHSPASVQISLQVWNKLLNSLEKISVKQ